ncbi:hypothetical protein B0H14DRAFT_2584449 [Mycena olivaceomarginata]|nr:hypothetical protein B0H14DRAFT_2584449 [Mycena olivaceomarginata]
MSFSGLYSQWGHARSKTCKLLTLTKIGAGFAYFPFCEVSAGRRHRLARTAVSSCQMPQTMKAQWQSGILYIAENHLAAAIFLEDDADDPDLLGMNSDDEKAVEKAKLLSDDVSDMLDLTAVN